MKKIVNRLAGLILVFICTLTLCAAAALACIRLTLFEQNYMIEQVERSDYVPVITKEINEGIADIGRASNIPPSVFDKVVSQKLTAQNIESYIRGIYTDVPFNMLGQAELEQKIASKIQTYGKENNLLKTDDKKNQAEVERIEKESVQVFNRYIQIPYILTYGKKVMAYKNTLTILIVLVMSFFLLLLIGAMIVQKSWWHRRLRLMSQIFAGAGLMLGVLPGYLYLSHYFDRLALASESLYRFLTNYLNGFLLMFIQASGLFLLMGLVCLVVSEGLRVQILKRDNRKLDETWKKQLA